MNISILEATRDFWFPRDTSSRVLVDPSLIMARRSAAHLISLISGQRNDFTFFTAKAFANILNMSPSESRTDALSFFTGPVEEPTVNLPEINEVLALLQVYDPEPPDRRRAEEFVISGARQEYPPELIQILIDEWAFLTGESWIIAKARNTFDAFKKFGAVAIEFSEEALNKAVRLTLKKSQREVLTRADILRASAKWIAVGGSAASVFFPSSLSPGVLFGVQLVEDGFLLLDPTDTD